MDWTNQVQTIRTRRDQAQFHDRGANARLKSAKLIMPSWLNNVIADSVE